MPLDPETKPCEFLTILVAAGLLIFRQNVYSISEAFKAAEEFVTETEKRFGELNP
jgi:hypothetical protein